MHLLSYKSGFMKQLHHVNMTKNLHFFLKHSVCSLGDEYFCEHLSITANAPSLESSCDCDATCDLVGWNIDGVVECDQHKVWSQQRADKSNYYRHFRIVTCTSGTKIFNLIYICKVKAQCSQKLPIGETSNITLRLPLEISVQLITEMKQAYACCPRESRQTLTEACHHCRFDPS